MVSVNSQHQRLILRFTLNIGSDMEVSLKYAAWPGHGKAMHLLFWVCVTLIFLYDRRYLIQKAGLDHFLECVIVRLALIISLAYINLHYLIPRYFSTKRYARYFLFLILLVTGYVSLQSLYDVYLFGYVIGEVPHLADNLKGRDFFTEFPYNFITTCWYLFLTVALALSLEWFRQRKEIKKLRENVAFLKQNGGNGTRPARHVFLRTGTKQVRVDINCITHVQGLKDYSVIYTPDDKIIVKGSLKAVEEMLPGHFLRTHKSYMVSKDKMTLINHNKVFVGDYQIPVGRNYKKQVVDFISSV